MHMVHEKHLIIECTYEHVIFGTVKAECSLLMYLTVWQVSNEFGNRKILTELSIAHRLCIKCTWRMVLL